MISGEPGGYPPRVWMLAMQVLIGGLLAGSLVGCSRSTSFTVAVSGLVTVDGQPLESGKITFAPSRPGAPVAVGDIVKGKYSVPASEGPWPGQQTVRIVAFKEKSAPAAPAFTPVQSMAPSEKQKSAVAKEQEQYLPAKFNTESRLEANLQSGTNENVDFTLDTK
jgi:hypothetical protein